MRRLLAALSAAVLLTGCFPRAAVPEEERQRAERELEGARRFLEVAVHVGPFFGDQSKLLASDQPFSELELLSTPGGETIAPPAPERVLLPGTPVRIAAIEFPTGWNVARRIVMTPRHHPWVLLDVEGEARPVVLVLPRDLETAEAVALELDRWLAPSDPAPTFRALPEEHRRAIAEKRLALDMSARAVEMAWGHPARKVVDRPARNEDWTWPGERRRASFREDRLTAWSPRQ